MSKQPIVLDHPLIQHKLSILRREETDTKTFRELITEIAMLMCFEATRDLETEDVEIETPVAKCVAKQLKGKQPAPVSVWLTVCSTFFLRQERVTSVFTATPKPASPLNTTANCRMTLQSARFLLLTPCLPPAVAPLIRELRGKFPTKLRSGTLRAVHIEGQTDNYCLRLVFDGGCGNLFHHVLKALFVNDAYGRR